MLISTNCKLELLQDVDMLLFFERGIRGGINGGELRHFTANNPHLNSFEPNEKTTFGTFFDLTSLYAGTMQKMVPLGNYKWISVITAIEFWERPKIQMLVTLSRWISNILSVYTIATVVFHLPRRRYVYGPHGFPLPPKFLD